VSCPHQSGSLSEEERRALLTLARRVIERGARERRPWHPEAPASAALTQKRACFVSLHKQGQLRGCIGQVSDRLPLYLAVAESAYSASQDDPRFPPVDPGEVAELDIEISVLSPFVPIQPEEVEIGRHGLLLTRDRARGLLLPQVPATYGWDRKRFLEEICRKAHMEAEAWRYGASLQAFTAEVFGEKD
jgi:AmmeMemoRadiSam system protein A